MIDKTMPFSIKDERENEMKEILGTVYAALKEKGYNPINQLVGYILSEDPTYISLVKGKIYMLVPVFSDESCAELPVLLLRLYRACRTVAFVC